MISKDNYHPRFKGYRAVYGLVQVFDGLLTIIVSPFGYKSEVMDKFSEWSARKDLERLKMLRKSGKSFRRKGKRFI